MNDQARTVLSEHTSFVRAVPALAVSDVPRAVFFFAGVLGFDSVLAQADYGIARRDAVEVQFWAATGPEAPGPSRTLPERPRVACRSMASPHCMSILRHARWSIRMASLACVLTRWGGRGGLADG